MVNKTHHNLIQAVIDVCGYDCVKRYLDVHYDAFREDSVDVCEEHVEIKTRAYEKYRCMIGMFPETEELFNSNLFYPLNLSVDIVSEHCSEPLGLFTLTQDELKDLLVYLVTNVDIEFDVKCALGSNLSFVVETLDCNLKELLISQLAFK